jgi:serine/threonine protein phosphatase PrpC
LTFVAALDAQMDPFRIAADCGKWFAAAESLALHVLNSPRMNADELEASVRGLPEIAAATHKAPQLGARDGGYLGVGIGTAEVARALGHESMLERLGQAYGIWWTAGSNTLPAVTLVLPGLPAPETFAELLHGFASHASDAVAAASNAASAAIGAPSFARSGTVSADSCGFSWYSASASARGNVREINQDACLELPEIGLWAVADGMGGHDDGELASHVLVDTLRGTRPPASLSAFVDDVEDRVLAANRKLYGLSLAGARSRLVGSTLAALLAHGSHGVLVWAGDSRIYRLRAGELAQMTRDHSEVEAARHGGRESTRAEEGVITRAVGAAEELFVSLAVHKLEHRDRFLLCSDGLYRELADAELCACLAAGDCAEACSSLLAAALARECADNVTAVVVEFAIEDDCES